MCGETFMCVGGSCSFPIVLQRRKIIHVGKHPSLLLLEEADGDFHQKVMECVL